MPELRQTAKSCSWAAASALPSTSGTADGSKKLHQAIGTLQFWGLPPLCRNLASCRASGQPCWSAKGDNFIHRNASDVETCFEATRLLDRSQRHGCVSQKRQCPCEFPVKPHPKRTPQIRRNPYIQARVNLLNSGLMSGGIPAHKWTLLKPENTKIGDGSSDFSVASPSQLAVFGPPLKLLICELLPDRCELANLPHTAGAVSIPRKNEQEKVRNGREMGIWRSGQLSRREVGKWCRLNGFQHMRSFPTPRIARDRNPFSEPVTKAFHGKTKGKLPVWGVRISDFRGFHINVPNVQIWEVPHPFEGFEISKF